MERKVKTAEFNTVAVSLVVGSLDPKKINYIYDAIVPRELLAIEVAEWYRNNEREIVALLDGHDIGEAQEEARRWIRYTLKTKIDKITRVDND